MWNLCPEQLPPELLSPDKLLFWGVGVAGAVVGLSPEELSFGKCYWRNRRYGAFIAGAIVAGANIAGVIAIWGAIVVGAIVTPYGAFVVGAIIAGAFIVGATIAGAFIAGAIIAGAIVVGVNIAGAIVVGENFAGAFVEEHLSRSNCRLQRSKCGRSNSRRSICRITDRIGQR